MPSLDTPGVGGLTSDVARRKQVPYSVACPPAVELLVWGAETTNGVSVAPL